MSSWSSETMCTSTDDCFCHEHVRQSRSPNSWYAQRRTSSAGIVSTSGGCRLGVAKEHPLSRVRPQPKAKRLERDHFLGRDVAEVDPRPELLHEPGLARLGGRLEEQGRDVHLVRDLVHEAGAHLAGRPVDAGGAALAPLGDHLPGAGLELGLDPLHPLARGEHRLAVTKSPTWQGRKPASASFEPTSERTVKSRAKSAISSSLRSRGRSITPSEISTCVIPSSPTQRLYSSRSPCAETA